jgi:hypothetical protein
MVLILRVFAGLESFGRYTTVKCTVYNIYLRDGLIQWTKIDCERMRMDSFLLLLVVDALFVSRVMCAILKREVVENFDSL